MAHMVDTNGEPVLENGEPVTLITACPVNEATIVDTWHTLGMRGTGSHDVAMSDVFIPEQRTARLVPRERPGTAYEAPLYKFTVWASVASLAPIATGIARAAIDTLLALADKKTPAFTTRLLRDRGVFQQQIAKAEARLGAGRAYLYNMLEQVWSGAIQDRVIDLQQKIRLQLAATHAVQASAEAVDLVYAAAGATAIRQEHDFQRHFRDVHTITQHGFISASRYESAGQGLLGAPIEWPFFSL